jgi:hypothetical protein
MLHHVESRKRQSTARIEKEGIHTSESIKLYQSALHPDHWVAYAAGTGWVIFPNRPNGWEDRRGARGLDPVYLREVPPQKAFGAGFGEAIRGSGNGKAA